MVAFKKRLTRVETVPDLKLKKTSQNVIKAAPPLDTIQTMVSYSLPDILAVLGSSHSY